MVAGMAPEPFAIGTTPLIAIVRFHAGGDLVGTVDALARGGVETIELTIDTPGALAAVSEAAAGGASDRRRDRPDGGAGPGERGRGRALRASVPRSSPR